MTGGRITESKPSLLHSNKEVDNSSHVWEARALTMCGMEVGTTQQPTAQTTGGGGGRHAHAGDNAVRTQSGSWALEKSLTRPLFFLFSRNQEKTKPQSGTDLAVSQLRGSAIARLMIISAHVPGQHMWASAGPGPSSSSPKQWKSDGRVKIYKSVSAGSPLTKSKEKNIIESTA